MLVAQQRAVTLQLFTRYGSNARYLMDDEQQNPPRTVRHASWILLLEVRNDSKPMLVKPGGHLYHVDPARVANERALAPFVQDEVLLPTEIRYDRCKRQVKLVRDVQVEQLHTQVKLVGAIPDSHEPGFGYAL